MAGPIETAWIELRADTDRFEGEARRAGSTAGDDSGRGFSRGFGGAIAGLGAVVAGLGIGRLFTSAISGASDLGESINAVNVSFGTNAEGIRALSEDANTALGLTETQFNSLAVAFEGFASSIAGPGGDVVGTMDDLTTRAADFASVMNLEVNDAALLFQQGLAGETEGLRRFGIDLSAATVENFAYANGIAQTGEELTEAQKVQARYGLLMQETAQTQGDFANTSDQLANGLRILKATASEAATAFGAGMLPALQGVVGGMADLATSLTESGALTELGETVGAAMAPVIEAFGPAIGVAVNTLIGVIGDMGDVFGSLAPLVSPVVQVLGVLARTVSGVLSAAFTALGPVIEAIGGFLDTFAEILGEVLLGGIETLTPALTSIGETLGEGLAVILPVILDLFRQMAPIITRVVGVFGELFADVFAALMPVVVELFEELAPVALEVAEVLGEALAEALPELAEAFEEIMDALAPLIPILADGLLEVLETITPILPELIQGIIALKIATAAFSVVQAALNVIMRANPYILAATAIAALILGVKMAYDRFETFRNIVDAAWQVLQNVVDWVTDFGVSVWHTLQDAVDSVSETFSTVFTAVRGFVVDNLGFVRDYVEGVIHFFGGIIDTITQLFSGEWGAAWQTFKDTVVNFAGEVVAYLAGLGGLIIQGLGNLAGLLVGWVAGANWAGVGTAILDAIGTAFETALNLGGKLLSLIGGLGLRFIQWVGNVDWAGVGSAILGFLGDAFGVALNLGGKLASALSGLGLRFVQWLGSVDWGGVGSAILEFIGDAFELALNLGGRLLSAVDNMAERFISWIGEIDWGGVGTAILDALGEALSTALDAGGAAFDFLTDLPDTIIDLLPDFGSVGAAIGESISDGFERVLNGIVSGINLLIRGINIVNPFEDIPEIPVADFLPPATELTTALTAWLSDGASGAITQFDIDTVINELTGGVSTPESTALAAAMQAWFDNGNAFLTADDLNDFLLTLGDDVEAAGLGGGGRYPQAFAAEFSKQSKGMVEPLLDKLPKTYGKIVGDQSDVFKDPGNKMMAGLQTGMTAAQGAVQIFTAGLSIRLLQWVGDLSSRLIVSGVQLMNGLTVGIALGSVSVAGVVRQIGGNITGWVGDLGGSLVGHGIQAMNGLRSGLAVGAFVVANFLGGLRGSIAGWVGNLDVLYFAGVQAMQGLAQGLRDGGWRAIQAAQQIAQTVAQIVRNTLKIRSPSQVFAEIGSDVMAGFQIGLESGWDDTAGFLSGLNRVMQSAVASPAQSVGGGGAINVEVMFAGALPTDAQAYAAGVAAGAGVADELERRRVRMLARTSGGSS